MVANKIPQTGEAGQQIIASPATLPHLSPSVNNTSPPSRSRHSRYKTVSNSTSSVQILVYKPLFLPGFTNHPITSAKAFRFCFSFFNIGAMGSWVSRTVCHFYGASIGIRVGAIWAWLSSSPSRASFICIGKKSGERHDLEDHGS